MKKTMDPVRPLKNGLTGCQSFPAWNALPQILQKLCLFEPPYWNGKEWDWVLTATLNMAMIPDDATEDVALNFGDEDLEPKKKKLRHPMTVVFHLAFRILAIAVYLLCGWLDRSFVTSFVIIVLLLSIDFWTVKNITGRLLVGLRWWNYVDEDGESHWVFESRKNDKNVSALESRIFWLGLVCTPIIWIFLLITSLISLKLQWMIIVIVALSFNFANLFGYIRCKKDASKKIKSMAGNFLAQQLLKQAVTPNEETKQAGSQ